MPSEDIMKLSLTKNRKKDDFGIQVGCKVYIKELSLRNLVEKEVNLKEGDLVLKVNNTNIENLSLKEIKKLIDNSKEKLNLVIKRCSNGLKDELLRDFDLNNKENNLNLINGTNGLNNNGSGFTDSLATRNWLNQNVYVQPPTRNENCNENKQQQQNNSFTTNNNLTNGSSTNENAFGNDFNDKQQATGRNRLPISELSLNETNELDNNNVQPIPNFLQKDTQDDNLMLNGPLIPSHLKNQPQTPSNFSTNENSSMNEQMNGDVNNEHSPLSRPNNGYTNGYDSLENRYEVASNARKNLFGKSEARLISFKKEGNVGIRLIGGNQVGIFVTAIQQGSPAAAEGLQPGDKILKVNNVKMKGVTREEAVLYLLSVHNQIDLLVQYCKNEYDEILLNQKGDSFYIRANFNHQPAATDTNELTIEKGDIFHVTNTLFNGVVGHWYVSKLNENREEITRGTIPNESKANAIYESKSDQNGSVNASSSFTTSKSNDHPTKSSSSFNSSLIVSSMKAASFFRRRRSARRTKSLGKEHWEEEVLFADRTYQKLTAYQKIEYKHPGFVRPIVVLGSMADFARQKLLTDYPDKYELPEFLVKSSSNNGSKNSNHKENLSSAAEASIIVAGSSDTSHLDSLDDLERLKMMKKQREVEEDDEELQMASNQLNSLNLTDRSYQHQQRSFSNDDELRCDLTKQRHQNDELRNLDKNFDLNCFSGTIGKNSSLKLSSSFLSSGFNGAGELSFGSNSMANDSSKNNKNTNPTGGIIKLSSIKTIIDKGKHALLDITPQAVNRLNYAQLYPVVIYLKAESKSIIKDLRIRHNKTNLMNLNSNNSNAINTNTLIQNQKSSRKIFEECTKLEKNWSNLFTATINLTTADVWYKKLRETIEKQQLSNIWLSSSTPDPRIADDFLVLPMQNNRLSYASSPDSDIDLSLGSNLNNHHNSGLMPCSTNSFMSNQPSTSGLTGRLAKACSVPSIATIDDLSINQSTFPINPIKYKDNVATVDPVFSNHLGPTDSSTPTSSFQMQKTPTKHDQQHQQIKDEQSYFSKISPAKFNQNNNNNNFGNLTTSTFTNNGYAAESNTPTTTTSSSGPNSAVPTPNQLNNQMQSNRNSMSNNILTNGTLLNKAANNNNNQLNNHLNSQVNGSQLNGNDNMTLEPPKIDRGMKPSRFKGSIHERLYNGSSNNNGNQEQNDQITHPLPVLNNNNNNTNNTNGYNHQTTATSSSSSSTPRSNNNNPFINANGLTNMASMQDYMSSNSPNSKQLKRKSATMFLENNNNSATNNSSPYSSNYVSPTNTIDNRTESGPVLNGINANNFNNNSQFNQNGYQPTMLNSNLQQQFPNQMTNLMNGNPSLGYYSDANGFNNSNTYMSRHSTNNPKQFANGLLPKNQMDHFNSNPPQKLAPTPPPKTRPKPPPKPSHYQRTIDLPGYYPSGPPENGLAYLNPTMNNPANLPPPIPTHEQTYLQNQQQNYLSQQQARRRLPYADPNIDGIYMTTTANGLVNYQPQEIRNSYAQPISNGMQTNLARAMQQQLQGQYPSQSPYLNVPYPPRQKQSLIMNGNNINLPNQPPNSLIDLSANRDQRSSAFELFRKPANANNAPNQYQTQKTNAMINGHQMMPNSYYGLPPLPSPPLHQSK